MSESVDAPTQASLPLVADSVFKRYPGGIWANRGISLTIGPSEILGLLGPNGSGKTSFVRQITTETSITSGQIRVFGVDVESDPTHVKYWHLYTLRNGTGNLRWVNAARFTHPYT